MAEQWFVAVNMPQGQQRLGPMPLEQVQQMASSGQITPQNLVWKEGMPDWVPAGNVAEIYGSFQAGAPAFQPPPYVAPGGYGYQPPVQQSGTSAWIIIAIICGVGVLFLPCIIVVCLAAITMIGTNSSQTFSKIGSTITTQKR
jgi:type IV pilus assembly protein PilA